MAFLLVTHDLNLKNGHPRYKEIQNYLGNLSPMTLLTENSVGVTTSKSVTQVYLDLKSFLTDQDTLLVVPLGDSWAGQISTQQQNRDGTSQALTAAMGEKLNQPAAQVVVRPIGDVLKDLADSKARAALKP